MQLIDHISKFGAAVTQGYHHVAVKVFGISSSWTTFSNAGALENVKQALASYGIGYDNISYDTVYSGNPFAFGFTVSVVAQDGQSDAQVMQAVLDAVNPVLNSATASIVDSSTAFASGSLSSLIPSISDVFGNSSTGQIAGISATTIIVLAVGIGALFLLRPSTIPRRLR